MSQGDHTPAGSVPNERYHLSYLYTVLVVAFGESIKSATRITSVYSFTSVIVGCLLGLVVRYARRLKPLCVSPYAAPSAAHG